MNANHLFEHLGIPLSDVEPLAGGDINQVFRINDTVFKVNDKNDFPDMFKAEKSGLEALSSVFETPEILDLGHFEDLQFLKMKYVAHGKETTAFWESFGAQLALLHQQSSKQFGWKEDNYIGALRQKNDERDNWKDFLIEMRLQPMIEMAVNSGEVNFVEAKVIEQFYQRIEEIYPKEAPALLHGDLWNGNFLCGAGDKPYLIDPAVYYGHREIDLGMMQLFGGFDESLYQSYQEVFPLAKSWKERIKVNQLYPLLVHVNLFGRGYWAQVKSILDPFKS